MDYVKELERKCDLLTEKGREKARADSKEIDELQKCIARV